MGLDLAVPASRAISAAEDKAAPDLINAEVLQAIRAHERRRLIDEDRSSVARQALVDLPLTRYPTLTLLGRAWELRQNFTAYDAMYVALAEALATSLVTADDRLAAAVRAHTKIKVVLLS